jgi:hypothetical protein
MARGLAQAVDHLPNKCVALSSNPSTTKKKKKKKRQKDKGSQVLVAHTCNLSYSGDRDQEDHSSKTAWANSS